MPPRLPMMWVRGLPLLPGPLAVLLLGLVLLVAAPGPRAAVAGDVAPDRLLRAVTAEDFRSLPLDSAWQVRRGLSGAAAEPWQAVRMPDLWQGPGAATYRTVLHLPAGAPPLVLQLPQVKSALEVVVNGRVAARNGRPSAFAADEVPWMETLTVPLPQVGRLAVTLRVSNHFHAEGGFGSPPRLMTAAAAAETEVRTLAVAAAVTGALLLMAVYTAFLAGAGPGLRRLALPALLVGSAARVACTSELLHTLAPGLGMAGIYRIEYATIYLFLPLYYHTLESVFPGVMHRRAGRLMELISGAGILATLTTAPLVFTQLRDAASLILAASVLYFLWRIAVAVRRGELGALPIVGGGVLFMGAAVHDALMYGHVIEGIDLVPFGILAFLLTHAVVLTRRMLIAMAEVRDLKESLQRQVERRTREADRRAAMLEAAADSANLGFVAYDADGRILAHNPRFANLLRLPEGLMAAGATIGGVQRWLREEGRALGRGDWVDELFLPPGPNRLWRDIRTPSGFVFSANASPLPEGETVATLADVTVNRQAEHVPDGGVAYWDRAGVDAPAVVSPQYWSMLGYDPAEVPAHLEKSMQKEWLALVHPDDRGPLSAAVGAALGTGHFDVLFRCHHASKGWIWVRSRGLLIRDEDGNVLRVVGTHVNLDTVVRAEEALRQAKAAAEDEARENAHMLAVLGHEVRTPLNAIIGLSRVLRGRGGRDEAETLDTIDRAAGHLAQVVDDILDLSRAEAGRDRDDGSAQPSQVLDAVIRILSDMARGKGLEVRLAAGPECDAWVNVNAVRLRQVLFNLLSNAIKFTPAGAIEVTAAITGDGGGRVLEIAVTDSGPGVPDVQRRRIFEPFERSVAEGRPQPGTGLGLAVAARLVRVAGGTLTVGDRPGDGPGAVFTVSLPVRLVPPPAAPPARGDLPQAPPLSVLVVEDAVENQMVLKGLLEPHGHRLTFADSGEEGLALLAGNTFDIVLLDIWLPGIPGTEVARRIRAGTVREAAMVPLIALTASTTQGDIDSYLEAGIDEVIVKPMNPDDLFEALARHAPEGPVPQAALPPPEAGPSASARRAFVAACRAHLEALEQGVPAGDVARVRAALHRLKGSAASYGYAALGNQAGALAAVLAGAEAPVLDQDLRARLDGVAAALQAVIIEAVELEDERS